MISHAEVIKRLGGGTECAKALSADLGRPIDREAVYKWQKRDLIPAKYWPAIERVADSRGLSDITVEVLEQTEYSGSPPLILGVTMSGSLKDVCSRIGLTTGISPATIYEWQRALVAAGVLAGQGRGPGSGVRATPQNIAILLIRVMFAGGPAPAAKDLHYWQVLKRTEILGPWFEGEPQPILEADPDWPASGAPTFGRALTALLEDAKAAALVESIEFNRALKHAVIHLHNRQARKSRRLRFGAPRWIKREAFTVTARLDGKILRMLVATLMNDPSGEHEGEDS